MNLQTAKKLERELARKALCYWLPSDWKNALLIHKIFGLENQFNFIHKSET
jgi:hypothetical protein|tara:strand:+ start:159 stop:311 length:153 start_codon:yes stop_codon:yes gene_type:complete